MLVEFGSVDEAGTAAESWRQSGVGFRGLGQSATVSVLRNMKGYSSVSLNPDVIQFFNLFPGPGDASSLWESWKQTLPSYFDAAEFRSSFPLLAVDDHQPVLLANPAHLDSAKHFLLSMAFYPKMVEDVERNYVRNGFALPHPFFC